jgi:hypothetical protein
MLRGAVEWLLSPALMAIAVSSELVTATLLNRLSPAQAASFFPLTWSPAADPISHPSSKEVDLIKRYHS